MKLRDKKTGKVFDVIVREKSNGDGEYSIIVCNLRALRSARSVSSILGEYDSLAKLKAHPEILTEWFTEIKDHAPLEGSIDYDLFVIDSQNTDTTQEQLRDCIKDALEQIISRLKKLEEE